MNRLNSAWSEAGCPAPDEDGAWCRIADIYGCSDNDLRGLRREMRKRPLPSPPFSAAEIADLESHLADQLKAQAAVTNQTGTQAVRIPGSLGWPRNAREKLEDHARGLFEEAHAAHPQEALEAVRAFTGGVEVFYPGSRQYSTAQLRNLCGVFFLIARSHDRPLDPLTAEAVAINRETVMSITVEYQMRTSEDRQSQVAGLFSAFARGEICDLSSALAALSIRKGRFLTPNEYLGYDERHGSFVTVRITPDPQPQNAAPVSETREPT
jgi:hypothetical protein